MCGNKIHPMLFSYQKMRPYLSRIDLFSLFSFVNPLGWSGIVFVDSHFERGYCLTVLKVQIQAQQTLLSNSYVYFTSHWDRVLYFQYVLHYTNIKSI